MRTLHCLLLGALLVLPVRAGAELLDPDSVGPSVLTELSDRLDDLGIDTALNLNVREVGGAIPRRPRLGALADLPPMRFPLTPELFGWEQAFNAAEIGAVAFLPAHLLPFAGSGHDHQSFYDAWLSAGAEERFLISFHASDRSSAAAIATVLGDEHGVLFLPPLSEASSDDVAEPAGRLYATAGQRWVVDSEAARDYRSEIAEFLYLGEILQRDSDSVIDRDSRALRRVASREPAVFLKEGLGDEFEASTIPEIVVPGGIALGESAVFESEFNRLVFQNGGLWLESSSGLRFGLPAEELATWKSNFDFAARSADIGSDAIVDIDERGRVKISSAFTNTNVGEEMVRIDTEPFNYVRRLDVRKSVIIDTSVRFSIVEGSAEFETEYEVRFLQSDRMRIATTQAAVVYRYSSDTERSGFRDTWGPDAFRMDGRTDFEGLGASTANVARHAAWIALFRRVMENSLDFSHGRYEFLKINKEGRSTPSRV